MQRVAHSGAAFEVFEAEGTKPFSASIDVRNLKGTVPLTVRTAALDLNAYMTQDLLTEVTGNIVALKLSTDSGATMDAGTIKVVGRKISSQPIVWSRYQGSMAPANVIIDVYRAPINMTLRAGTPGGISSGGAGGASDQVYILDHQPVGGGVQTTVGTFTLPPSGNGDLVVPTTVEIGEGDLLFLRKDGTAATTFVTTFSVVMEGRQ